MPLGVLPPKSHIQYGNVIFPVARHVSIDANIVMDDAKRTIKWVEYMVQIEADITVAGGAATGATLQGMYNTLMTPGLGFVMTGTGHPNLLVPSGDAQWGPMLTVLSWTPLSGPLAARVNLVLRVTTAACPSAVNRVAAWGYSINRALVNGYETRTINSYIEIQMSRISGTRRIPDTAESYKFRFVPEVPEGFRRESYNYTLSQDKRRLDIAIVDRREQSEYPYPVDVVKIDFEVSYRNAQGAQDVKWQVGFNGSIETPLGLDHRFAFTVFALLVQAKLNAYTAAQGGRKSYIPQSIDIGEPVFRKAANFSLSFLVIGVKRNILQDFDYGENPVPTSWTDWKNSMIIRRVWDPTGYCGLNNDPGHDAIVDLCGGQIVVPNEGCIGIKTNEGGGGTIMTIPRPHPESSYTISNVAVVPIRRDRVAMHNTLQAFNENENALPRYEKPNETRGTEVGGGAGTDAIIQNNSNPNMLMGLSFELERVEYEIPTPTLLSVDGKTPRRIAQIGGGNRLVRRSGGIPIYRSEGIVLYGLENVPGRVEPVINHSLVGGGGPAAKGGTVGTA